MNEQIDLKLLLESVITGRREDNSERTGDVAKVYLTPSAPTEFRSNFPDGTAWLVNEIPLRVRATPNSEEEFEVMPAWIVYEHCSQDQEEIEEYSNERDSQDRKQAIKDRINKMSKNKSRLKKDSKYRDNLRKLSKSESSIEKVIEDVISDYLGKGEVNEVGYDVLAYDSEDYNSPNSAYQEFVKSSKGVSDKGATDVKTARNFLRQVYKGGNNTVRFKEFVRLLVKKGITVTDRRENRVADLEIVGESKVR